MAFNYGLPPASIHEQLAELKRELAQRNRLYPGWIKTGKLDKALAERRLNALEAAIQSLERLAERAFKERQRAAGLR